MIPSSFPVEGNTQDCSSSTSLVGPDRATQVGYLKGFDRCLVTVSNGTLPMIGGVATMQMRMVSEPVKLSLRND
jgi:hypothetical protein